MNSPYEASALTSWRHSLLSLFRTTSPERESRTSIHVASVARFSPAGRDSTHVTPKLVNVSDFADSSLSDQLHDSENIFLVIEGYAREPTYYFTEEIAAAVGEMVDSENAPALLPNAWLARGSLSSGALLDHLDQDPTPQFRTPQSSLTSSAGYLRHAPPKLSLLTVSLAPTLTPFAGLRSGGSLARLIARHPLHSSAPRAPAPVYVAPETAAWAPVPESAPLARSYTRDSRSDLLSMFSEGADQKYASRDLEKCSTDVPVLWTRWAAVLVCGLVALPVFFLVAFGMFDRGGYTERPRGVGLGRARYTRAQRALSLVLGLLWLAVVFSMVGVGLGLALRARHD